ncbi:MAG: ABC transporter permease [Anaerolineae bacterium]
MAATITTLERTRAASPLQLAARQFFRHRMAVIGLIILTLVALYVVVGSVIFTEADARETDIRARWAAPSAAHPFGTDSTGRDVLARTIYGGQISLVIALLSVTVTTTLGVLLGIVAGYYGGWIDSLIMRGAEALLSIPLLFFLLVLSKTFENRIPDVVLLGRTLTGSVVVMILIIGFTGWMSLARIVRASALSLKERDFVLAARALGMTHTRILLRHILPNALAPVIVFATLGVSQAILLESYVSFLGVGVSEPTPSWGNMLQRANERLDSAPWLWIFPGLLVTLTVVSINFIGDGLRDALDPARS